MKTKIASIVCVLASISMFGQAKEEWGPKFDYDSKNEIDAKVVLVDNYNHYMSSVINKDASMQSKNEIIIRKFDQKNQLITTTVEDFQYKDPGTLHNYLGSFELGTDKLVFFTDCYSGKTKKKEIFKTIFDKKTSAFSTTLVAEYTFESLMKSGTTTLLSSQNNNYIGIVYSKFANKKIAEEHECILIDAKTSDVIWKQNITAPLLSFTQDIVLSNSGKFIFVKKEKETGSKNVLSIADGKTVETKNFEEDIKITEPIVFSIDSNDYLLSFCSYTHGISAGDFAKIIIYDVNAGKTLKTNTLSNFSSIPDLKKVNFNKIAVQNNEIQLFVDCDYKTGTKPDPTFPNSSFTVPVYSNGNAGLLTFSMDGNLKNTVNYNVLPSNSNKCYKVQNFGGNYYMNTTLKYGGMYYHGVYKLNTPDFNTTHSSSRFTFDHGTSIKEHLEGSVVNQFCDYLPDSKRLLLAKTYNDGKMAFISVIGVEL